MLVWKQYLRCNFLLWSNKDNCFRLFICHESKFYLQHHTCGSHAYSNVILSPRARMMLFKLMLTLELDTIQKKISISTFLSLDRLWWRYIILTTDLVFGIKKKSHGLKSAVKEIAFVWKIKFVLSVSVWFPFLSHIASTIYRLIYEVIDLLLILC